MSNVKFCKVFKVGITAFVFDNVLETIIALKGITTENAANLQTENITGEEGENIWQYRSRVGLHHLNKSKYHALCSILPHKLG